MMHRFCCCIAFFVIDKRLIEILSRRVSWLAGWLYQGVRGDRGENYWKGLSRVLKGSLQVDRGG